MCVSVCECASVSVCNWFYKLIHGPQKQILVFFCLEIWILAWRSHGQIMELFSEIFVGTLPKLDHFSKTTKYIIHVQNKRTAASSTDDIRKCKNYTMTSSNRNIIRITGPLRGNSPVSEKFPAQRPVTWSFDVFFVPRLNKGFSKSWRRWFAMPARSLWCHCNEPIMDTSYCHLLHGIVHHLIKFQYDPCHLSELDW